MKSATLAAMRRKKDAVVLSCGFLGSVIGQNRRCRMPDDLPFDHINH